MELQSMTPRMASLDRRLAMLKLIVGANCALTICMFGPLHMILTKLDEQIAQTDAAIARRIGL